MSHSKKQNNADTPDAQNPEFMFQGLDSQLLAGIVNGNVDAAKQAAREMASRGLDKNGQWVGFKQAAEIHGLIEKDAELSFREKLALIPNMLVDDLRDEYYKAAEGISGLREVLQSIDLLQEEHDIVLELEEVYEKLDEIGKVL